VRFLFEQSAHDAPAERGEMV